MTTNHESICNILSVYGIDPDELERFTSRNSNTMQITRTNSTTEILTTRSKSIDFLRDQIHSRYRDHDPTVIRAILHDIGVDDIDVEAAQQHGSDDTHVLINTSPYSVQNLEEAYLAPIIEDHSRTSIFSRHQPSQINQVRSYISLHVDSILEYPPSLVTESKPSKEKKPNCFHKLFFRCFSSK